MNCKFCGAPLRSFAECRPIEVDGILSAACADLDGCRARVELRRAAVRDSERSDMYTPAGSRPASSA